MAVALLAGCVPWAVRPVPVGPGPGPGTQVLGCEHAREPRVEITVDTALDPSCEWAGGIEVTASGVTLDCRGARIVERSDDPRRLGIAVRSPAERTLEDVVVRSCVTEGFLNGIRVTRDGFRSLPAGGEFDTPLRRVTIEDTHVYRSRGSGIFVDAYTVGVTLRRVEVAGAGSVGVYLEAGSRDHRIEDSWIHHNGYGDVRPEGVPFEIGGVEFRYLSTGREGIAVDGSAGNVIRGNVVEENSAGGIFLYKNCGEYATSRPGQHWVRREGAVDNRIETNVVRGGGTGVWVASRQGENQVFLDCSDPAYERGPLVARHLDHATDNVVSHNTITGTRFALRVEDDRTTVIGNTIVTGHPEGVAVLIGTRPRTERLGRPVTGTVLRDNRAYVAGRPDPYRWFAGHLDTVEGGNLVWTDPYGDPVVAPLVAGPEPPRDPFLFVRSFWVAP